jgi:hypothetical protein
MQKRAEQDRADSRLDGNGYAQRNTSHVILGARSGRRGMRTTTTRPNKRRTGRNGGWARRRQEGGLCCGRTVPLLGGRETLPDAGCCRVEGCRHAGLIGVMRYCTYMYVRFVGEVEEGMGGCGCGVQKDARLRTNRVSCLAVGQSVLQLGPVNRNSCASDLCSLSHSLSPAVGHTEGLSRCRTDWLLGGAVGPGTRFKYRGAPSWVCLLLLPLI